jgi:branched-chain amino acid aminotransferase
MPVFVNWNGKIVKEEQVVISPNNRSFKYGDGCFETMKVINDLLLLKNFHFQRLFSSLETLKFDVPPLLTADSFLNQILELVKVNGHHPLARIRLVVYRGEGGLYDLDNLAPNFIIQTSIGSNDSNIYNSSGFILDFFPDARKTADRFSSIKSNNYLGYAMGALWAKQHQLDDCLLINAHNRLADATIANIFIITNGVIKTPSLSEGCINGVMRKYLIECFLKEGIPFREAEITMEELLNASEVFLTNATYGIRWVKKVASSNYSNTTSSFLHLKYIVPLFNPTTI